MGLRRAALFLCVMLISGCAGQMACEREAAPRTLAQIYRKSSEPAAVLPPRKMELLPDAGAVRPYWPVYAPPRIRKVWVPAHVAGHSRDTLVAGHWAFLMVEEPHWYIERHDDDTAGTRMIVPVLPRKEP
ncbi:MAG: hypothetical protein WCI27_04890 [Candidatus Omnitrophota bacterium]